MEITVLVKDGSVLLKHSHKHTHMNQNELKRTSTWTEPKCTQHMLQKLQCNNNNNNKTAHASHIVSPDQCALRSCRDYYNIWIQQSVCVCVSICAQRLLRFKFFIKQAFTSSDMGSAVAGPSAADPTSTASCRSP